MRSDNEMTAEIHVIFYLSSFHVMNVSCLFVEVIVSASLATNMKWRQREGYLHHSEDWRRRITLIHISLKDSVYFFH